MLAAFEQADAAIAPVYSARDIVADPHIHPAQVAVINEVFTPSAGEVARALKLIAAFEKAEQAGAGVTTDDTGRMVDVAVVRSARDIVARGRRC